MDLTSFFDWFDPLSMGPSLNLQLRSAHKKPQQPNWFDSPTDPGYNSLLKFTCLNMKFYNCYHTNVHSTNLALHWPSWSSSFYVGP